MGSDIPLFIGGDDVFDHFLCHGEIDLPVFQIRKSYQFVQRSFQLPDIGFDVVGNVADDFVVDVVSVNLFFFAENCHSGLIIRRGDIGDQSPFETGLKPCLQCFQILGRTVAGDDDLLIGAVEGVKLMEKFLLSTFLADDELDIVDEKYVDVAVFFPEFGHTGVVAVTDGINQFIGK